MSAVLTPLFLVAGTFFPTQRAARVGAGLANLNPLYHCVELVRHAAFGWDRWDGCARVGVLVGFGAPHVAHRDLRDDAQARGLIGHRGPFVRRRRLVHTQEADLRGPVYVVDR